MECFWDQTDSRLFAIETEFIKDISKGIGSQIEGEGEDALNDDLGVHEMDDDFKRKEEEEWTGKTIETFFVTSDYGIKR